VRSKLQISPVPYRRLKVLQITATLKQKHYKILIIINYKEEFQMEKGIILPLVLVAILIGTGLAENEDIGDVEAFKQALEQDGFHVSSVKPTIPQ
jgi:Na+/H+-dicarboxylate symporter